MHSFFYLGADNKASESAIGLMRKDTSLKTEEREFPTSTPKQNFQSFMLFWELLVYMIVAIITKDTNMRIINMSIIVLILMLSHLMKDEFFRTYRRPVGRFLWILRLGFAAWLFWFASRDFQSDKTWNEAFHYAAPFSYLLVLIHQARYEPYVLSILEKLGFRIVGAAGGAASLAAA